MNNKLNVFKKFIFSFIIQNHFISFFKKIKYNIYMANTEES